MRIHAALVFFALFLGAAPPPAAAQIAAAPDITVDLSGVAVDDHQVAIDDLRGGIALETLGGLPAGVEVDAYHETASGEVWFSIDTTAELGGVTVGPEDVVRFDGVNYALVFDGSQAGIPAGANLDALTQGADGGLIFSLDVSANLGGYVFGDEDLVLFNGGSFGIVFQGALRGFDPALDLDAVDHVVGSIFAISFDGYGSHNGVAFADEDVLQYDLVRSTTSMLFDASAAHPAWDTADLGALVVLPEPGVAAGLLTGAALVTLLSSTRRTVPT